MNGVRFHTKTGRSGRKFVSKPVYKDVCTPLTCECPIIAEIA
jgi:hypothetical protein